MRRWHHMNIFSFKFKFQLLKSNDLEFRFLLVSLQKSYDFGAHRVPYV